MKRILFLLASAGLVLAALAPAFSTPEKTPAASQWASPAPVLDGRDEDWQPGGFSSERSVRVDYAFKNDGRNLYILLVFKDPKFLSSIDATGIRIFWGRDVSAGNAAGVLFVRKTVTAEEFISILESRASPLSEKEKEVLRINPRHSIFDAYAVDSRGKTIPPPDSRSDLDPPEFRAGKRNKATIYEFRVPLPRAGAQQAGTGAGPGETVRVSFEWGGASKDLLNAKTSWATPATISSGGLHDENGETPAQQFLNSFDRMSGPSSSVKKYSFQAVVRLAQGC
jgi:hypothetical protein